MLEPTLGQQQQYLKVYLSIYHSLFPKLMCAYFVRSVRFWRDHCVFTLHPLLMFLRHSDVDVWAALEAVQMKSYVQGLSEGLDAPVSEGGSNVSVSGADSWPC